MTPDDTIPLDSLCETAAKSGELDLMKEILLWALRWKNHIPREAKQELSDITFRVVES